MSYCLPTEVVEELPADAFLIRKEDFSPGLVRALENTYSFNILGDYKIDFYIKGNRRLLYIRFELHIRQDYVRIHKLRI
jgi:hypothetical protein